MLADPNVDGVICVALGLGDAEQQHLGAEEVIQQLSEEFDKPVVVWVYGSQAEETINRLERSGPALAVPSLERGVRAPGRHSPIMRSGKASKGFN